VAQIAVRENGACKLDVDDIDALAGSRNKVWNQTKRVFRLSQNRLSGISGSSHGQ
jgi:hypothetical protein